MFCRLIDFAASVQNGRVVPAAEMAAKLGIAGRRQPAGDIHGQAAGVGDGLPPRFALELGERQAEILGCRGSHVPANRFDVRRLTGGWLLTDGKPRTGGKLQDGMMNLGGRSDAVDGLIACSGEFFHLRVIQRQFGASGRPTNQFAAGEETGRRELNYEPARQATDQSRRKSQSGLWWLAESRDDQRAAVEQSIERGKQEPLGGRLVGKLMQIVDHQEVAAVMMRAKVAGRGRINRVCQAAGELRAGSQNHAGQMQSLMSASGQRVDQARFAHAGGTTNNERTKAHVRRIHCRTKRSYQRVLRPGDECLISALRQIAHGRA
jgi:hypothetical protein